MKSTVKISIEDITLSDCQCIVNAANENLLPGGGVCGAIFRRAGYDQLDRACRKIGFCETGRAVITPGFNLKSQHIIHTPGPVWRGGNSGERDLLYSCYKSALALCVENNINSISFPLISSGIFGYPLQEAWQTALLSVTDFFRENPQHKIDVKFCVLEKSVADLGRSILEEIQKNTLQ